MTSRVEDLQLALFPRKLRFLLHAYEHILLYKLIMCIYIYSMHKFYVYVYVCVCACT